MSPRWIKVARDIALTRGRFIALAIALAAAVAALTTMLVAHAVLTRAAGGNYIGTNPASAQIQVERLDPAVIERLRARPEFTAVEAGGSLYARVRVSETQWLPLLLFVIPDFEHLRVNAIYPQAGAWPPPTGAMLIERSAMGLTQAAIGDTLDVEMPRGGAGRLQLAGVAHDPGLAPAWQEQTIYGYVTPETLTRLGEDDHLDLIKLVVAEGANDMERIAEQSRALAGQLRDEGVTVREIRVPPPGLHPHQGQMTTVLGMLLNFSTLVLLLAAVLAAHQMSILLTQHARQIAIMKAIGARARQIAGLYVAMILALGVAAAVIGVPLGLSVGLAFARAVAQLLNLELATIALPWWSWGAGALLGVFAPLLAAVAPIALALRRTVREVIADSHIARDATRSRGVDRLLARWRVGGAAMTLAVRNSWRRRGRLALGVGLLAAAGAMFLTSMGMQTSWRASIARGNAERHYDIELRLSEPREFDAIADAVRAIVPDARVENWDRANVGLDPGATFPVVHNYPDGGHGVLNLRAAPPESRFFDRVLDEGRWLLADDEDVAVLNSGAAHGLLDGTQVGDTIVLRVDDTPLRLRVVGTIRQTVFPATVYVPPRTFARALARGTRTTSIRVALSDRARADEVADALAERLAKAAMPIDWLITDKRLAAAQGGHYRIMVLAMVFIAALMAVVGLLGLATSLGAAVRERTREIGVLRAIGARAGDIRASLLYEGAFVAVLSIPFAQLLMWPLASIASATVSRISAQPLQALPSLPSTLLWTALIVPSALLACWFPARRAIRLHVRETLTQL